MNTIFQQFWINLVLVLSGLTTLIRFQNRTPKEGEVRNILVFQLTELGDVALSSDVIIRLRERYPQAQITLACGPWAKPIMEGQPFVDRVFVYQSNLAMTAKHGKLPLPVHWEKVQALAALPTDLIVDLRGNLGSVLAAWLSPARYRVDRGSLRWHDIVNRRQTWDRHEAILNQEIVRPLGIEIRPPQLYLTAMPDVEEDLQAKLLQAGLDWGSPYVIMHPGSSWIAKRWREERFAALASLIKTETRFEVILTGSKAEEEIGEKIVKLMALPPVNLIGRLTLREILSLYAKTTLWIGNDTGTMHVAVALDRPVVVLWGPTKAEKFGPCGLKSRVVRGIGETPVQSPRGKMDLIQVSEVWKIVQQQLLQESCHANT